MYEILCRDCRQPFESEYSGAGSCGCTARQASPDKGEEALKVMLRIERQLVALQEGMQKQGRDIRQLRAAVGRIEKDVRA